MLRHARTFAALTLVSRVLAVVRDGLAARILGVSGLGTAFAIAFQFPNTFRRLFGEGALSAAFIPEYAQLVKRDPALSDRFASLITALMALGLAAIVMLIEIILVVLLAAADLPENGRRAIILLAIMLPYMPLICITAVMGGMLQTHGRFAAQAGAPIILNLCMIAAAAGGAYALTLDAAATAMLIAASVTVAGVLQLLWCLRDLRGLVIWSRIFEGAADSARRMFRKMGPVVLGLGMIQITTLIEAWAIIAWPIYVGPTILGHAYPLDDAAGAALTNAQRLYQFPLGVFGIALATAAFPLLARLADDPEAFTSTLRRGIRIALFIALPATAGLIWVAHHLTAVVYMGGRVDAEDAARIARCLIFYAPLVGTYSVTHVITRAFYARGDTKTPAFVSVLTAVGGLLLGAALMWWMREEGLALGSSIAAAVQVSVLGRLAHHRLGAGESRLFSGEVLGSLGRMSVATIVMLLALGGLGMAWPSGGESNWSGHAVHLAAQCMLGVAAFGAAAWFLCRHELRWIMERRAT